jgi:hypothetical protein
MIGKSALFWFAIINAWVAHSAEAVSTLFM